MNFSRDGNFIGLRVSLRNPTPEANLMTESRSQKEQSMSAIALAITGFLSGAVASVVSTWFASGIAPGDGAGFVALLIGFPTAAILSQYVAQSQLLPTMGHSESAGSRRAAFVVCMVIGVPLSLFGGGWTMALLWHNQMENTLGAANAVAIALIVTAGVGAIIGFVCAQIIGRFRNSP
jgi:hypothetical protein